MWSSLTWEVGYADECVEKKAKERGVYFTNSMKARIGCKSAWEKDESVFKGAAVWPVSKRAFSNTLRGSRAISRSRQADGGWQRRAQDILSAGFLPKRWLKGLCRCHFLHRECKDSLARPVLFITLWPSWQTVHFYSVGLHSDRFGRFGFDLPSPFSLTCCRWLSDWRPKECQGATASCVGERAGYVSKLQTDGPPDTALHCSSPHPQFIAETIFNEVSRIFTSWPASSCLLFLLTLSAAFLFIICLCTWRDLVQNDTPDLMLKCVMNAQILFVGFQIAHCRSVILRKARQQNYAMDSAKTLWEQIKVRVVSATFVSTVSHCLHLQSLSSGSEPTVLCVLGSWGDLWWYLKRSTQLHCIVVFPLS